MSRRIGIDARRVAVSALAIMVVAFGSETPAMSVSSSSGSFARGKEVYSDGSFRWTPSVSVSLRTYGDVIGQPQFPDEGNPYAHISPNGRYFFVLSARGDMDCQCTFQTLEVYESVAVQKWLAQGSKKSLLPYRSLQRQSQRLTGSPNSFSDVRWDETSSHIRFVGLDDKGKVQLHDFSLVTGQVVPMTNVEEFRAAYPSGDKMIVWHAIPDPKDTNEPIIIPARRDRVGEIEFFGSVSAWAGKVSRWIARSGNDEWILNPKPRAWFAPVYSPDKQFAVLGSTDAATGRDSFLLLNFQSRNLEQIALMPGSRLNVQTVPPQTFWSTDSKQLILVNTGSSENANDARGVSTEDTASDGYISVHDIRTKRTTVLEPFSQASGLTFLAAGWLRPGEEFLVTHNRAGKRAEGTLYVRSGDHWVGHAVSPSLAIPDTTPKLPGNLRVYIREGANQPQLLVASERGREAILSKSDSALENVWIAQEKPFSWTMPDGSRLTGGLTLPRDTRPGKPMPLVVQFGDYQPKLFMPDGLVSTGAYARQAMVAHGMAVLVLHAYDLGGPAVARAQEGPTLVARLNGAVRELIRLGIADPERIGLTGHSRFGYYVHYAITHPSEIKYSAAEIWDSVTQSLPEYLDQGARGVETARWHYERLRNGPFWSNKQVWLDQDPLLNADKNVSPTLFAETGTPKNFRTAYGPGQIALQTIGAYRLLNKPVEYIMIPDAGHIMSRVAQRLPAMEIGVDWMRFWLKNEEDPRPDKVEQYRRWRKILENEQARKKRGQLISSVLARGESVRAPTSARPAHVPGQDQVSAIHEAMKAAGITSWDPDRLNLLGYQALYNESDTARALRYFGWNYALAKANNLGSRDLSALQDSLAEGFIQSGDVEQALRNYAEAISRSPQYGGAASAAAIVDRLRTAPTSIDSVQKELRSAYEAAIRRR